MMPDCLIVGGGVVGLSLAYQLSGRGVTVEVIDRGDMGREASWAGAGILPPANRATAVHPLEQLRALSQELHPKWAVELRKQTGIDTGFRECGGLYLARSAGEVASLVAFAEMLRDLDIAIDRIPHDKLTTIEPGLKDLAKSGTLKAAYTLPGEAQLRNPDHLRALAVACEQNGVLLRSRTELIEIEQAGKQISGLQTSQGRLEADRYCLTSGAWTYALLRQLDITTGIMPVKGQMVMFKCDKPPFDHVLNEGPRYLVPRDDGRVLVGSTEEEVGFDKSNTEEGVAELIDLARQLVPSLHDAEIERTWAGLRPGSFDGFPYLGAIPGFENAFTAAGHFRSGLHMSTGTALVMTQLMLGESPEIDLTPFRVGRG
jgi:glycine oxidase